MFQLKNRLTRNRFFSVSIFCAAAFLVPGITRAQDTLYVGDFGDNSVKRFDAGTGHSLDSKAFVPSGSNGLHGPRGILFDPSVGGSLILVNQNAGLDPLHGEIFRYSAKDGQFQGAIVQACRPPEINPPNCNPDAPFGPGGIIHGFDQDLFVADSNDSVLNPLDPSHFKGKVTRFDDQTGIFLGNLDFGTFQDRFGEYHPRALVFGPDGLLYVSVVGNLDPANVHANRSAGFILRFKNRKLFDVFAKFDPVATDNNTCPDLHRPDGVSFGPDGKLYVASFQADASDTDKILIFDIRDRGSCNDKIILDPKAAGHPTLRTSTQSLVFGPDGRLFVPIFQTGEVRSYDVSNKTYTKFVPAGKLVAPWYLTFGRTDNITLEYH